MSVHRIVQYLKAGIEDDRLAAVNAYAIADCVDRNRRRGQSEPGSSCGSVQGHHQLISH
jgi:hypothetical protein